MAGVQGDKMADYPTIFQCTLIAAALKILLFPA
jgi:hypothetical protein